MIASEAAPAAEAATPKTAADWEPYISTDVKRVTPSGSVTVVRLLQVKHDAASIRHGKNRKPVWVPLKELAPHQKRVRGKTRPLAQEEDRYVLVDVNHHLFFWAGKGKIDPKWVTDPRDAASYGNIESAWSARGYHRKKRPQVFPSHIDIKPVSEAVTLFAQWSGTSSDKHVVGQMAREILDKHLPKPATPPTAAPAAQPVPAPFTSSTFDAWAAKRRELAVAEAIVASVRGELAELEAQLDIELKQRLLQ